MASAASEAAVASHRGALRATARNMQDAVTAAWLCAIPCAAIVATAIALASTVQMVDLRHLDPQALR